MKIVACSEPLMLLICRRSVSPVLRSRSRAVISHVKHTESRARPGQAENPEIHRSSEVKNGRQHACVDVAGRIPSSVALCAYTAQPMYAWRNEENMFSENVRCRTPHLVLTRLHALSDTDAVPKQLAGELTSRVDGWSPCWSAVSGKNYRRWTVPWGAGRLACITSRFLRPQIKVKTVWHTWQRTIMTDGVLVLAITNSELS